MNLLHKFRYCRWFQGTSKRYAHPISSIKLFPISDRCNRGEWWEVCWNSVLWCRFLFVLFWDLDWWCFDHLFEAISTQAILMGFNKASRISSQTLSNFTFFYNCFPVDLFHRFLPIYNKRNDLVKLEWEIANGDWFISNQPKLWHLLIWVKFWFNVLYDKQSFWI